MMTDESKISHPKLLIPSDGLTEEARAKLLEGVHVLIEQIPELHGYKFEKNISLKDHASLLPTREASDAFIASYGDISPPFSIEVSDDGQLFRVLPHEVYQATGKHARVKCAVPLEGITLESRPDLLFGTGKVFARKTWLLPQHEMERTFKLELVKEEAEKTPHLLPGYTSVASPYWLGRDNKGRLSSAFTKKCPNIPEKRHQKISLYMPLAPGRDLFDWWAKSGDATDPDSEGYRFKKYTPLILASVIIAVENFRLHEADQQWAHRDLKLENFMYEMSDTDPVDIVIKLVDPGDIARVSEGHIKKLAGTLGYMGKEIFSALIDRKPLPMISPKTDSYAIAITLLQLCFYNFDKFLINEEANFFRLMRDCISYNRMMFRDDTEQVYYMPPWSRKWILLKPILPEDSPDYQSLYQKVKAIAPMLHDDPNSRPLAIDVLREAFMPEVEYLVDRDPALKDTPAIQALFDVRPETEPDIQQKPKPKFG